MLKGVPGDAQRIAIVTQGYETGGGVATVTRWLREELTTAGYAVDIHDLATSSRDPASRRLIRPDSWLTSSLSTDVGPAVNHWGANLVEIEPMRYRPRRELTQCLSTYDLIQVVSGTAALAVAVASAGPPVLLQVATILAWERESRRAPRASPARAWRDVMTVLSSRTERRGLRQVDCVFVENDAMYDAALAVGSREVVKAPPGVDTDRYSPRVDGWNSSGYLLSVSRLNEPRKGLNRLLEAYGALVEGMHDAPPLILAGRGTLPIELRDQIERLGLRGRVTVQEDVEYDRLPALYREASAFVQTSYEEGLGLSVLEAMASGVPVIATVTAGSSELVAHGDTGWLVPQPADTNVGDLVAARVRDVLAGSGRRMSHAARCRTVAVFSNGVTIARYLSVYERLLATHDIRPVEI